MRGATERTVSASSEGSELPSETECHSSARRSPMDSCTSACTGIQRAGRLSVICSGLLRADFLLIGADLSIVTEGIGRSNFPMKSVSNGEKPCCDWSCMVCRGLGIGSPEGEVKSLYCVRECGFGVERLAWPVTQSKRETSKTAPHRLSQTPAHHHQPDHEAEKSAELCW